MVAPYTPARAVSRPRSLGDADRRPARLCVLAPGIVAALPRLVVLLQQRDAILPAFTFGEKSDDIARTYVATGTFGFIPGHPTAYTQPLYSYFLIPLYWAFGRTWEVVGGAQIIVAVATVLLVYELGRRWLSRWAGPRRGADRRRPPVLALARRAHQAGDSRRPPRRGDLARRDDPARAAFVRRRDRARGGLRARDPVECAARRAAVRARRAPHLVLAPDPPHTADRRCRPRRLRGGAGAVGHPQPDRRSGATR